MKYKRILLKLSGESLMGKEQHGIDPGILSAFASGIKDVVLQGVGVGVVIGGGNIYRGMQGCKNGIDRVQGDYMGMLATVINGLGLQAELDRQGVKALLFSGIAVEPICSYMTRKRANQALEKGKVVIVGGGTGNPFFTTDSAAALRALEMQADVLLKGTRVDGVYTADPEKNPDAVRYESISFDEVYQKQLNIMDLTAFTMCRDNNLPVIVFNMDVPGNLLKVVSGEKIGTLVHP